MSSIKTNSILRSFIVIPMIATSLSLSAFTASIDQFVVTQSDDQAQQTQKSAIQLEREENAAKIDTYFANGNMPLEGYGMKMVLEAEKNELDWRLIPAIAVRESTGGKYACKKASFSAFGWGSCKISFKSYDHAIESLASHLSGNNTKTARYYANKDVKEILETYNPPSVVPTYAREVMAVMDKIEEVKL
ncbi:MAG: glucosaminidase domain-containing protein [Candidatus Pacebacteria bacterium]|nr:glucosaminidase domain-containing protein [Candidatus Paceibacterota bacterium]